MVVELLGAGAESTRTAKELCCILGLELREFYSMVEAERLEGNPICASRGAVPGYYLAGAGEEAQGYCGLTARAVRKAAEGLHE